MSNEGVAAHEVLEDTDVKMVTVNTDNEENAQVHLESLMMIKMEKSDSSQKPRICVLDLRFHQKNIPRKKFFVFGIKNNKLSRGEK